MPFSIRHSVLIYKYNLHATPEFKICNHLTPDFVYIHLGMPNQTLGTKKIVYLHKKCHRITLRLYTVAHKKINILEYK